MPRVTYQYIRDIDPEQLTKMKKPELTELLRKVRAKFQTREKQLSKADIYSPALEGMKNYYEENGRRAPTKATRNQTINEILRIKQFMNAKSSDVKGARELRRETNKRIFGEDILGNPAARMNTEQEKSFWSHYNEFMHQYNKSSTLYSSGRVMQSLGEMWTKFLGRKKNRPDLPEGIDSDILKNIKDILDKEKYREDDEAVRDAFSGDVFTDHRDY